MSDVMSGIWALPAQQALFRRHSGVAWLATAVLAGAALVPLFAVPAGAQQDAFQAKLDAAVSALDRYPRFRGLTPEHRELIAEFMAGNTLFIALHELSHAVTSQMQLPSLDRKEDAADAFAVVELAKLAPALSDHVLEQAAKGWFVSDQRAQDNGNTVAYFDDHGIDRERAERIACLMVGAGGGKFQRLAAETKIPQERREGCGAEYEAAAKTWDDALKPRLRRPDQPKTKIDVVYAPADAKGKVEPIAQAFRSMGLLEAVAAQLSDTYVWPAPFTIEMESCGYPSAQWLPRVHKLGICYELAADFGEFYRTYGDRPSRSAAPKPRTR
jgi:Putative metallopeptidase